MRLKSVIAVSTILTALIFFTSNCSNLLDKYKDGTGSAPNPQPEVIAQNAVGATTSTTLRTLDFSPDDSNSIFVSQLSGNDTTGTGTQSNPVATINRAINLCDAQHQKIVILDSETYEEQGFEFTGDFKGLYAALGQAPVINILLNPDLVDLSDNELLTGPVTYEASTTYTETVTLANGNIFIIYRDDSDNSGKIRIIQPDGTQLGSTITFTDNIGASVCSTLLLNGNIFIIFTYDQAYYCIYSPEGNEVLSPQPYNNMATYGRVVTLSNGNALITFLDSTGHFTIIDLDGNQLVAPTVYENGYVTYNGLASFPTGNAVVAYCDQGDSNAGKFCIISSSGVPGTPLPFGDTLSTSHVRAATLNNGNAFVAYSTSGNIGRFIIISPEGSIVAGPETFDPDIGTGFLNVESLNDGNACIVYRNSTVPNARYCIRAADGTEIIEPTEFAGHNIRWSSVSAFLNNTFLVAYEDADNSFAGNYQIYYPYSWTSIRVSTDATINGLVLDLAQQGGAKYLIDVNSQNFILKYCDLKACKEPGSPSVSAYAIYSDYKINISNSKFYDNENAVYISANSANISDSQFYRNDNGVHINGSASSSLTGDIEIDHCDFLRNNTGVILTNNSGNELIKNNIFHNNVIYGINAATGIDLSNSVITGSVLNVTYGASVNTGDPLYINEGNTNPDDIDLNLQTILMGYANDSPAIGLADDGRNAGSYDVDYVDE